MELFDALRARTSVRSFSSRVPGDRVQVDLLNYLNNVPVLLPDADIAIELLSYEDLLDYFPGEAEKMIRAPLYLAFRGEMELYQLMNVGYYAEHAGVWLTGRELDSVWQSGFRLRQLQVDEIMDDITPDANLFSYINSSEDERAGEPSDLAAAGYAASQDSLYSSYSADGKTKVKPLLPVVLALGYSNKARKKPARKKKLKQLMLTPVNNLDNNVLSLLESARLAPSEYNYQPWRFAVDENNLIHIFMQDNFLLSSKQRQNMLQVSMGCCLGNMEIMAALRGIILHYGLLDDVPEYGQSDKKLYYLGTIRTEKVYRQMMFGIDY